MVRLPRTTRRQRQLIPAYLQRLELRAMLSTIAVTSLEDNLKIDGQVTLREALHAARDDTSVDSSAAGGGHDVVEFAVHGTIRLTGPLPVIDHDVSIRGLGEESTRIEGIGVDILTVDADTTVELSSLSLSSGDAGLRSNGGLVFLDNVEITENETGVVAEGGRFYATRTSVHRNALGLSLTNAVSQLKSMKISDNVRTSDTTDTPVFGAGMYVSAGSVEVTNSRITGNRVNSSQRGAGGGMYFQSTDASVFDSVVSDNIVNAVGNGWGAGITNSRSDMTLVRTTISGNQVSSRAAAYGAALTTGGDAWVDSVSIFENAAVGDTVWGGAIYNWGHAWLRRIGVYNNTAEAGTDGAAAGIYEDGGRLMLIDSTLSANKLAGGDSFGVAITIAGRSLTEVHHSTIVGHRSGVHAMSDVSLGTWFTNSVFANDERDLVLRRSQIRVSYCFLSSNQGSHIDSEGSGNIFGTKASPLDPALGPLSDNGGPTLSHKPLAGSPLINRGEAFNRPHIESNDPTDQRGFQRIAGKRSDIGAVEYQPPIIVRPPSAYETDDSLVFDVSIEEVQGPVTVFYETTRAGENPASGGRDYVEIEGELHFESDAEVLSVEVPMIADSQFEQDETVGLKLWIESHLFVIATGTIRADWGAVVYGGTLHIRGAETVNDKVSVFRRDGDVLLNFNTVEMSFDRDITRIFYEDRGGDNSFRVSDIELPVVVETGSGADFIQTGRGPDSVNSGDGDDSIIAGRGEDTVFAGRGADSIRAGAGADEIHAERGDDRLFGGPGDDSLFGGPGDDRLFGAEGMDFVYGHSGNDFMDGGPGDDELCSLRLNSLGECRNTELREDELDSLTGADGNDLLHVSGAARANGGRGNDRLHAVKSFSSTILGASGADTLSAEGGVIDGGDGPDIITVTEGRVMAWGGRGSDFMSATGGNGTLVGGTGNDRISVAGTTGTGGFFLFGNDGNDRLEGHPGSDVMHGGAGNDRLYGNAGDDSLFAGEGDDTVWGHAGDDILTTTSGMNVLHGGAGHDFLIGGTGQDTLRGNQGHDVLLGGEEDDLLLGQDGRDLAIGGIGMDTLIGGKAQDLLVAGTTSLVPDAVRLVASEWQADSRDLATRSANIRNGSGGEGVNGSAFLNSATTDDDDVVDELTGLEDRDWFFARLSSDVLIDRLPEELFDGI